MRVTELAATGIVPNVSSKLSSDEQHTHSPDSGVTMEFIAVRRVASISALSKSLSSKTHTECVAGLGTSTVCCTPRHAACVDVERLDMPGLFPRAYLLQGRDHCRNRRAFAM